MIRYGRYRYVKAPATLHRTKHQLRTINYFRTIAVLFFFIGSATLLVVISPIVSWQFKFAGSKELINPLGGVDQNSMALILGTQTNVPENTPQPVQPLKMQVKKLPNGFSYFAPETPYTANLVKLDPERLTKPSYTQFIISIPKINVQNAVVITNSVDFDTHLGHLPGSALPGEVGNAFITGHSALPSFFSNTNYKAIFALLPKLELLDEIKVSAGGKDYTYIIEKHFVVEPDDISVITPPDPFGKYLTLMTCVPPGTSAKRLIVLARLQE